MRMRERWRVKHGLSTWEAGPRGGLGVDAVRDGFTREKDSIHHGQKIKETWM